MNTDSITLTTARAMSQTVALRNVLNQVIAEAGRPVPSVHKLSALADSAARTAGDVAHVMGTVVEQCRDGVE